MTTAQDVPAEPLIMRTAQDLKGRDELAAPDWSAFARTGTHTERPPEQEDWWWIRSAAILRKVYLHGPIGTERLAAMFGGKKDRGVKPYQSVKGSRNVIRTSLQQLEAAGLVVLDQDAPGRKVTPDGQRLLDNLAHEVQKELAEDVAGLAKY